MGRADEAHRTGTPIGVFVVDDQPLVRAGFRMVVDAETDMTVVGEAGNGAEAVERLSHIEADVVVMDLRMPVMGGVEATRMLAAAADGPRVLVLTTFDTEADAFSALAAGATGFLPKTVSAEELVAAIRVVAAGEAAVTPNITRRLLDRFANQLDGERWSDTALGSLTGREHQVLLLVARGHSNTDIAGHLGVTEGTVKAYVSRLLTKLGLPSRVSLVILAYEQGLVRPNG